jgi:general secretion pathway protein G
MKKLHLTGEKGFTLIELMVVMIILATLITIVAPRFLAEPEKARKLKAEVTIANLETALKTYYLDNEGGYLEKGKVPKDPWGHDFIYLSPGLHSEFDIVSYGSDGIEGGEGKDADVESWNIE